MIKSLVQVIRLVNPLLGVDTDLAKRVGSEADWPTLGGALGANIHGRGLALKPIIGDVESFTLMQARR
jgi:hypothetical protein